MEGRARRKNRVIVHVTKQINGGMVRKRFFVYRPRFCGGENKDKKKQRGRHILTENNTSELGINQNILKDIFSLTSKHFSRRFLPDLRVLKSRSWGWNMAKGLIWNNMFKHVLNTCAMKWIFLAVCTKLGVLHFMVLKLEFGLIWNKMLPRIGVPKISCTMLIGLWAGW